MTTIINTPPTNPAPASSDGGSGMGMIVGILVAIVVIFLFVIYGWPAMRGSQNANSENTGTTVNIPVPDKIDVNIKK
ncbi:MAG: hypothetical protein Q7S04_02710 [Candidatus Moranbacteria bacterium]|nr:hypothetical protein [Candidatus Moranbacteria bacterium]